MGGDADAPGTAALSSAQLQGVYAVVGKTCDHAALTGAYRSTGPQCLGYLSGHREYLPPMATKTMAGCPIPEILYNDALFACGS